MKLQLLFLVATAATAVADPSALRGRSLMGSMPDLSAMGLPFKKDAVMNILSSGNCDVSKLLALVPAVQELGTKLGEIKSPADAEPLLEKYGNQALGALCANPPVRLLQNTFSYRTRRIAQLRPGSSFLLSALRFLDRRFNKFFDAVIREYHGADADAYQVNDWRVPDAVNGGRPLDVGRAVAVRARASRNLAAFPLPGAMGAGDRVAFERALRPALQALVNDPSFGGRVYSLTPHATYGLGGNPNLVTREQFRHLVSERVMFEDMATDPHLASAGIAADWPVGRGAWASADGQCVLWFGEIDHLCAMVMKRGPVLGDAFDRLKKLLDAIETAVDEAVTATATTNAATVLKFATNDEYGYVTSCPSNLGTAMRASVRLRVPPRAPAAARAAAEARCAALGLAVRAVDGGDSGDSGSGDVDISPTARLFVTEGEIIAALFEGAKALLDPEAVVDEAEAARSRGAEEKDAAAVEEFPEAEEEGKAAPPEEKDAAEAAVLATGGQ